MQASHHPANHASKYLRQPKKGGWADNVKFFPSPKKPDASLANSTQGFVLVVRMLEQKDVASKQP